MFPENRARRLRKNDKIRNLVAETVLRPDDMILPVFFDENIDSPRNTDSMPGVKTWALKDYKNIAENVTSNGVNSVLVFGVPKKKDAVGSQAYAEDGVAQTAIRGIKNASNLTVIADLCMCEYTDHGHCGIIKNGKVDNDSTLEYYSKIAVSQADAGADMVAPSGMMDGQVAAIRQALDENGHKDVSIMGYSAKYKSAYYGPFRDLAQSCPGKGDRSGYQMDIRNRREGIREMAEDINEGADIIMVKPAGPYLDIIRDAADTFDMPLCAYQVSGEYAMIEAAAQNGWIDRDRVMTESLTGIKRAGADMIITYYAEKVAKMLEEQ